MIGKEAAHGKMAASKGMVWKIKFILVKHNME